MTESKEMLTAILGGLLELKAEVQGLGHKVDKVEQKVDSLDQKVDSLSQELKDFRAETDRRFTRIELRLDHLGTKWLEHDEEIYRLKHR